MDRIREIDKDERGRERENVIRAERETARQEERKRK